MNRCVMAVCAVFLTMVFVFPVLASAKVAINVPENASSVVFPHARHSKVECMTCHSATPSKPAPSFNVQMSSSSACAKCHDLFDGDTPPTEGCVNCHNDVAL